MVENLKKKINFALYHDIIKSLNSFQIFFHDTKFNIYKLVVDSAKTKSYFWALWELQILNWRDKQEPQ